MDHSSSFNNCKTQTFRRLVVSLCTIFTTVWLGSSSAEQELSLDLTGTIEPRCELNDLESSSADFDQNTKTIDFSLYCNTEMSMTLESANGGLLNAKTGTSDNQIADTMWRYSATVNIESLQFEKSVSSLDMVEGISFKVSGGVAFNSNGSLVLKLEDNTETLRAGTYTDEIKISIFPSLAGFN